jgi:hypothetical protein
VAGAPQLVADRHLHHLIRLYWFLSKNSGHPLTDAWSLKRERKETCDEFLSLVAHKNHPFY